MAGVVYKDGRPGPSPDSSDIVTTDEKVRASKELDADNSDSDEEATQPKRHGISERRRQQYSIFDRWYVSLAKALQNANVLNQA